MTNHPKVPTTPSRPLIERAERAAEVSVSSRGDTWQCDSCTAEAEDPRKVEHDDECASIVIPELLAKNAELQAENAALARQLNETMRRSELVTMARSEELAKLRAEVERLKARCEFELGQARMMAHAADTEKAEAKEARQSLSSALTVIRALGVHYSPLVGLDDEGADAAPGLITLHKIARDPAAIAAFRRLGWGEK